MTSLSTRTTLGRSRLLGLLAGATLVAMVNGCGSSSDGVSVTDPGAGASPSPSTSSSTELTIVVKEESKTSTYTLTCAADGTADGTHPGPTAACAALKKGAASLAPVAPGMMCTQIYGGPQTATITGTYLGKPVSSSFNRTNGCEISRWKGLEGLLPSYGTSTSTMTPQ